MNADVAASTWQLVGAGTFGAVVGWYVYYINRHRKDAIQISDIVTLIGAIGGGAVLSLFDKKPELFCVYGLGLGLGFFGYFLFLVIFVATSKRFRFDWFLDGRRKDPETGWGYPGGGTGQPQTPMLTRPRPLLGSPSGIPHAVAARATSTSATDPIVDMKVDVRELSSTSPVQVTVEIGNVQPGGWAAFLDGAPVGSGNGSSPLLLPASVVGKVLEVSATMKAVAPESQRLSLQVTLRDGSGAAIGAPILIEHPAKTDQAAAYSILVIFVEAT